MGDNLTYVRGETDNFHVKSEYLKDKVIFKQKDEKISETCMEAQMYLKRLQAGLSGRAV
jgi:hypothetical protein